MIHRIDAWLWRGGMHNGRIRAIVLVQLLMAAGLLLAGAVLSPWTAWVFWCGVGFALIGQVFYGLARYFSRVRLTAYNPALLLGVLGRMGGRLLLTACVLYVALIVCAAPALALCAGLCLAPAAALATYALGARLGLT